MEISSTFAQRLRYLLSIKCVKQTEVVKALGLKHNTFSNYVNGIREPKESTFKKIADYFNVDYAWLMGYDVPMERETDNHRKQRERIKSLILNASEEQLDKVLTYCKDIGLQ